MCQYPQYIQQRGLYYQYLRGFKKLVNYNYNSTTILTRDSFSEDCQFLKYSRVSSYKNLDNGEIYNNKYDAQQHSKRVVGLYTYKPLQVYLLNESTGEIINVFVQVKCGKCEECQESKRLVNQMRCDMESQNSGEPFFIRLSFTDYHLEKITDEPTLTKYFQKFFKRLRTNLQRSGYDETLKYLLITEYGSKTHRLHAHALIWFPNEELHRFQFFEKHVAPKMYSFIQDAWQYGQTNVQIAKDHSGKYTMKYMTKHSSNDGELFKKLQSKSLGREVVDKHRDNIERFYEDSKFEMYDIYTGRIKEIPKFGYILNRILPTFCRAVPKEIRDKIQEFYYYVGRLRDIQRDIYKKRMDIILDKLGIPKVEYEFYDQAPLNNVQLLDYPQKMRQLYDEVSTFFSRYTDSELKEIAENIKKRTIYTEKIISNVNNEYQWITRKQNIIKQLILQKNKENDGE